MEWWKLEGWVTGLGNDAADVVNASLPPIPSVVEEYDIENVCMWYITSVSFVFNLWKVYLHINNCPYCIVPFRNMTEKCSSQSTSVT